MVGTEWYAGRRRTRPIGHRIDWPERPPSIWRTALDIFDGVRHAFGDSLSKHFHKRRVFHRIMRCGHSGGHLWQLDNEVRGLSSHDCWRCRVCGHFEWFEVGFTPTPNIED